MRRHRISTAALLLTLCGAAACGGGGSTNVTADSAATGVTPAAAVAESTTTTAPAATTTTADPGAASTDAPTAAAPPAVTPSSQPEPATITVKYEPHDGANASATIEETGETKSLADGSAVFSGLAAGTYTVDVTSVFADDTGQIVNRSRPVALQPGDHAVIVCDDSGCTGVVGN